MHRTNQDTEDSRGRQEASPYEKTEKQTSHRIRTQLPDSISIRGLGRSDES